MTRDTTTTVNPSGPSRDYTVHRLSRGGALVSRIIHMVALTLSGAADRLFRAVLGSGNAKMRKTAKLLSACTPHAWRGLSWSLPAVSTCAMARRCKAYCYALQGRFSATTVALAHVQNWHALETLYALGGESLVTDTIARTLTRLTLRGRKFSATLIRWHAAGDFHRAWYARALSAAVSRASVECASRGRLCVVYLYTKRIDMVRSGLLTANAGPLPSSGAVLRVVQSVGGTLDHLIDYDRPHARVFGTHEERKLAGYVDGNDERADIPAIVGETRIGLVYHGSLSASTVGLKSSRTDNY